ncbi:MAG: SAM-dependent methyltransferase [Phycisphaerae bacterium]|nr:SAM-dependent methyltransferase [Phycisphaerae bacterium]
MAAGESRRFVSRAGDKLDAALAEFTVDCLGLRCADFGCNVGGFVDCMLQRGAASVIAIDTGYGTLAWTLRNDPRVTVRERTNALHADPPSGGVDLISIDLAWTPQRLAVPAALRWLAPGGRIITLIKPHYEVDGDEKAWLSHGFLPQERAPDVLERVLATIPALGADVLGSMRSPLVGGKTSRTRGVPGNVEFLALLQPRV